MLLQTNLLIITEIRCNEHRNKYILTRMWANAQRDGRPAKYRWHCIQRGKVWLTPTTTVPCSNAANTRNLLKLAGVPQTTVYEKRRWSHSMLTDDLFLARASCFPQALLVSSVESLTPWFGAPQLISIGFAYWQRYCTAL